MNSKSNGREKVAAPIGAILARLQENDAVITSSCSFCTCEYFLLPDQDEFFLQNKAAEVWLDKRVLSS